MVFLYGTYIYAVMIVHALVVGAAAIHMNIQSARIAPTSSRFLQAGDQMDDCEVRSGGTWYSPIEREGVANTILKRPWHQPQHLSHPARVELIYLLCSLFTFWQCWVYGMCHRIYSNEP